MVFGNSLFFALDKRHLSLKHYFMATEENTRFIFNFGDASNAECIFLSENSIFKDKKSHKCEFVFVESLILVLVGSGKALSLIFNNFFLVFYYFLSRNLLLFQSEIPVICLTVSVLAGINNLGPVLQQPTLKTILTNCNALKLLKIEIFNLGKEVHLQHRIKTISSKFAYLQLCLLAIPY